MFDGTLLEQNVLLVNHFFQETIEDGLNSLRILAHNQSPQSLIPSLNVVVQSVNRILDHKKRLIRKTAADVKNMW